MKLKINWIKALILFNLMYILYIVGMGLVPNYISFPVFILDLVFLWRKNEK